MKIEYDGKVWEFAFLDLTVDECEQIEKFTACRGLGEWYQQVQVANTRAIQALWWAVRRHAGEDPGPVARRDPALRPVAFNNAVVDAEKAEEEAKAAAEAAADPDPDPTPPAASSPARAATTMTTAAAAVTSLLPG